MPQPLIGITASRINKNSGDPTIALSESYSRAVAHGGGVPVTIPLGLPDEDLLVILSRLDGVLFSGGGDVETARYHGNGEP